MDGCGSGLRHWLVFWCLFQATFAADLEDGTGTCPEITPDDETYGAIPLYMGVFPKADEWKLNVYFKGKASLRLSLYPEGNVINAETMRDPDDGNNHPKVKWDPKAFPKGEWSYLALYPEEKFLVASQRRDMAAATVKRVLENDLKTVKIETQNVDVTYNCSNEGDITFAKNSLQVNSNETYVQAAGSEAYLTEGSSKITATNTTWHEVDSGSYLLNGAVFVRYSLDGTVHSSGAMSPSTVDIIMCFVSLFVLSMLT